MTPEQKIKTTLLLLLKENNPKDFPFDGTIDTENVDQLYDELHQKCQDYVSEFRNAYPTDLPSQFDRNYECYEVADKMFDGSWVGWTYWYGGGKHGHPEEIPWMNEAYSLDCEEKLVTQTVRVFKKI